MAKKSNDTITVRSSDTRKNSFSKRAVMIPIAAALFGMTAVTAGAGAVGYGPLSGMFTKYFGDAATEKLAEEGYVYTADDYAAENTKNYGDESSSDLLYPGMDQTISKDGFTVGIAGIAGDTQDPQMLLDIRVDDDKIAEQSDILGVYLLVLGSDEFDTNRQSYLEEYGKAVKDDTDPKLYHASIRCPPLWINSGEEIVADVICIHAVEDNNGGIHDYYRDQEVSDFGVSLNELLDHGGLIQYNPDADMSKVTGYNYYNKITEHKMELQFRFTIPENTLKEAAEYSYDELVFDIDGTDYRLNYAQFGAHHTFFTFDFDYEGDPKEFNGKDFKENDAKAKKAGDQFVLTVDGKEYKAAPEGSLAFCDNDGICNLMIKDMAYLSVSLPAIDIENAKSITLSANGRSYDLLAERKESVSENEETGSEVTEETGSEVTEETAETEAAEETAE